MNGCGFDEWNDYGIYAVAKMGTADRDRFEILEECRRRKPAFQEAMSALTAQQRDAVEAYMVLRENLEDQNARLAYELGKQVGRGMTKPVGPENRK